MSDSEDEKMAFQIRLQGKPKEIFLRVKEETGLQSYNEVIRYIIVQYDNLTTERPDALKDVDRRLFELDQFVKAFVERMEKREQTG